LFFGVSQMCGLKTEDVVLNQEQFMQNESKHVAHVNVTAQ
jgi:hypothetical protein